jgi:hypothetical protein
VCGIAYPTIGLSISIWKRIIDLLTKLLTSLAQ